MNPLSARLAAEYKEGLVTVEFATGESTTQLRLHPRDAIPPGMVEASGFGRGGAFPAADPDDVFSHTPVGVKN